MIRVCTLMYGNAWERYGETFAKTFTENWEEDIEIVTVTDRELPFERSKLLNLNDIPDFNNFLEKWNKNPIIPNNVPDSEMWRFHAIKWMPQGITPKAVLDMNSHWKDGDILVWMDADCETHDHVNEEWIEYVLGDNDVASLFRKPIHTEIGFFAIRLNEKTREAMNKFASLYCDYTIFEQKEWHSAFAWDVAIDSIKDIKKKNLNPTNGEKGLHVFPYSILAEKIVHWKGKRKDVSQQYKNNNESWKTDKVVLYK